MKWYKSLRPQLPGDPPTLVLYQVACQLLRGVCFICMLVIIFLMLLWLTSLVMHLPVAAGLQFTSLDHPSQSDLWICTC